MARVLFAQTEWFEHLGILYLAASARSKGHQVSLLLGRDPEKLVSDILEQAPDMAAFSATTGAHRAVLEITSRLRSRFSGMIVMGGPHPTFFPEVLNDPSLDAICRGEADLALPRLLDRLDRGEDHSGLPGFWVKKDGSIIESPPADLVTDLDSLPFPARELLSEADPRLGRVKMARIMAGRGCPYSCTYCFNEAARELVKGKGPYVRLRSVDNVMAELKLLRSQGKGTINFVDDTFGLKREWALELLQRYRTEVGLPFIVNLRPEQADEEMVGALKGAGCYCVQMGVESASDPLRRQVLGREVSERVLGEAARRIKQAGLLLLTYNMVGLPGETLDQAAATLEWNASHRVDFPRVSIFQPYPRTALGDRVLTELCGDEAMQAGHDKNATGIDAVSESYFRSSPLPGPEARRIENLQKLFLPYIKLPALRRMILALTRVPANPVFDFIFLASIGLQYRRATNRSWCETLLLGLRNLRAYFQ